MEGHDRLRHLHLVTVVWGEYHRSTFTSVILPSLLSPENLPALVGEVRVTYTIFTTRYDALRIRSSKIFDYLTEVAELKIVVISSFRQDDIFSEHHRFQHRELSWAREHRAMLVAAPPDVMWSDGSFAHIRRLYEIGKRAVFLKGLRVSSETFVPDLLATCAADPRGAITVPPRILAKKLLQHAHPLTLAQFVDSPEFPIFAEALVWPVEHEGNVEGILVRAPFPSDFLVVFPAAGFRLSESRMISEGLDFDEIAFITDSDDMMLASLTPLMNYNEWFLERGPIDLIEVARSSLDFGDDLTVMVGRQNFRIHTGNVEETVWKAAVRRADLTIHGVLVRREYLRLWRLFTEMGLRRSAKIIAMVLHEINHPPFIGRSEMATVFVPIDTAYEDDHSFTALLDGSKRRSLVKRLATHVVAGQVLAQDIPATGARLRTLSGLDVVVGKSGNSPSDCDARIVESDIIAGIMIVHTIDRLFPAESFQDRACVDAD